MPKMAEEYGRTRSQTKEAREAANGAGSGGSVPPSASPARLTGDFDDEDDSVAGAAAPAVRRRTPRQRQPRLTAANTNRNATSGTAGGASGRSRKAVVARQQNRPTARPGPAGTAVPAEQDEAAAPDQYVLEYVDLRVLGPDLRTKVASFLASSSLKFSALPGIPLYKRSLTYDRPIDVDETMAIALRAQCAAQFAINRAANVDIVSFDLTSTYRAWDLPSLKTLGPVFARLVPTIESLRVNNLLYWHGDWHEKIRLLFDYLDEAFSTAPQLHTLDISDNALWFHGPPFMPGILGGNTNVCNLNMGNCGGFDRQAAPFFLRLAESPVFASRLESLDLSRDTLYDAEAASVICTILANASRMKKLALDWIRRSSTDYHAAAMYSLARMAQRVGKTSLVDLSLSAYPMIDPVSGTCIIDHLSLVLRLSPNLREFTFSHSSGMDDESSARIIDALREGGARLRVLELSDTGIGEVATMSLTNYIRSNLTNSLETICIRQTEISFGDVFGDVDLSALLPALTQCTKLMVLDISDNDFSEEVLQALLVHRIPSLKRLVMPNIFDEQWGLFAGDSIDAELKEKIQSLYPVVVTEE